MRPRMFARWWLSLVVATFGVGLAAGQDLPQFSVMELEKDFSANRQMWKKLTSGDVLASANERSHMAAVEAAGRYYAYRFANPTFRLGGDDRKTITGLYDEFEKEVYSLIAGKDKEKTRECGFLLAREIMKRGRDVLFTKDPMPPLVQVNLMRSSGPVCRPRQPGAGRRVRRYPQEPSAQ